jgi:hypothetical protein
MADKPLSGLLSATRTLNFRTNLDNEDDLVIELVRQFLTATSPGVFSLIVRKCLSDYFRKADYLGNALLWVQQEINQHDVWERQRIKTRLHKFIRSDEWLPETESVSQQENDLRFAKSTQNASASLSQDAMLSEQSRASEQANLDEAYGDFDFRGIGGV